MSPPPSMPLPAPNGALRHSPLISFSPRLPQTEVYGLLFYFTREDFLSGPD